MDQEVSNKPDRKVEQTFVEHLAFAHGRSRHDQFQRAPCHRGLANVGQSGQELRVSEDRHGSKLRAGGHSGEGNYSAGPAISSVKPTEGRRVVEVNGGAEPWAGVKYPGSTTQLREKTSISAAPVLPPVEPDNHNRSRWPVNDNGGYMRVDAIAGRKRPEPSATVHDDGEGPRDG